MAQCKVEIRQKTPSSNIQSSFAKVIAVGALFEQLLSAYEPHIYYSELKIVENP